MALPNLRMINAPDPRVVQMISRRLPPEFRKELAGISFDTIALINAAIPNIYYFADVAMKAGDVYAADISGTCPQHITTLALFGDVSSVTAAVSAIEREMEIK